ncbi:MAG TPA: aspartate aminotransferase family protein [Thermoplasmata archaeon]|nr:aspartate aminotransferase family protein [Thermoplasmata archaeon]
MATSSERLSLPETPRIVVPPPGPNSRALLEEQSRLESPSVVYPRHFPIAIRRARGSAIEDVDGNRFIDWIAGVCVLNLGHGHPRLRAAIDRQLGELWHGLEIPTEARIAFLRELSERLPGRLRHHARVLFGISGGDAVETAVSIADHLKGRRGTIVFSGAYHGVHGGAVALTSGRKYHRTSSFGGARVVRVPFPDPYRPVLGESDSSSGLVRYLEHLVRDPYSGVDELSSVLVEPILGEGGYVVPPDDFLPALREFCDDHDLLLIADEIQTGLGRTGKRWAVEHSGVTPDLVCIAKSIGGGIPLSLVAYADDLGPDLPPAFHLGTFRANPLALAAGTEYLRELDEGGWVDRVAHRGSRLLEQFRSLAETDPTIGSVRGRGFMVGVEFVREPKGRVPSAERAREVRHHLLQGGVLMHTCGPFDQVLRFMAPLTIEDDLLDRGLESFGRAIVPTVGTPPGPVPHGLRPGAGVTRVGPLTPTVGPPEPIRPGLPL